MDPQKQSLQQSPWKKPKIVSLSKSKSLKRKSELFNASLNNTSTNSSFRLDSQGIDENAHLTEDSSMYDSPKSAKITKTHLNRFSIMNTLNLSNSLNNSTDSGRNEEINKNDLYSFFASNKESNALNESSSKNDDKSSQKTKEAKEKLDRLASTNSSLITNIYSPANSLATKRIFSDTLLDSAKKDTKSDEPQQINMFENKKLIPTDWSLKTRLRFLSTKTFSCNNCIKSQQESEAILNFSKFNSFYKDLDHSKYNTHEQNKDLYKTLFGESVNYWTFPYLPWLNLYPRNIGVSSLSSEPLNVEIQKTLSKCWNQSFKSLYNSLKSNQCPYFYLLTQSFMVLFRSQNINGIDEMHAILTPSTKGLRETLKDISFTMPLSNPSNQNASNKDQSDSFTESLNVPNDNSSNDLSITKDDNTCNDEKKLEISNEKVVKDKENCVDDDEDEENDQDSDEPDEWLEQIGLNSTVNFKASILQRNNKDAQKDLFINFDSRPRSTLLFSQGSDVQALFNFLLNSKSCITNSGPLAGIPPTLLSPITFVGATLQKIKVEQNVVKSLTKTGDSLTQYALDFIGPIMPYHIHRLCNLFRVTQQNEFEMVANTYEQSAALNCVKKEKCPNNDKEQITKYLDTSELNSLEENFGIFGESNSIKSICIKDDMFCCN